MWYRGIIAWIDVATGRASVRYDDGDFEKRVRGEFLRVPAPNVESGRDARKRQRGE